MHEIEAMQACLDALYSLTPEERARAFGWLQARVIDDLQKEQKAAITVGHFLRAVA